MPHVGPDGLSKQFGAVEVFRDLNFAIETGELCALLGPSGLAMPFRQRLSTHCVCTTFTKCFQIHDQRITVLQASG